jgi:hypothetical protein
MNASAGVASKDFVKDKPCFTNRQRMKRSSRGCIKVLCINLAKDPNKNVEEELGLE